MSTLSRHTFRIDQRYYASNISTLPMNSTFDDFRRTRALFSWLVNTRPEVKFLENKADQVTPATYSNDHIKE